MDEPSRPRHLIVHCALPVLVEREATRGQVRGLARGYLRAAHEGCRYDREVDTTATPAAELARLVLSDL